MIFRLAYVPGVMPAKWVRTFGERRPGVDVELVAVSAAEAADLVRAGDVDAALARPLAGARGELAAITLYDEVPVVVLPKDHLLTVADELSPADLVEEWFVKPLDDVLEWADAPGETLEFAPETTADAVEVVAEKLALLVTPMSLARLHHRRDLTYRPLVDGPPAPVTLIWPEPTSELVDEFIGVVRGRRAGSSRGQAEQPKRSAKEKAAARRAAKEAAGTIPRRTTGRSGTSKSGKPGARRGGPRGGR